jgi:hypothetical protein
MVFEGLKILSNNLSNLLSGGSIALEHAIIMMLSLAGLLSIRGKGQQFVPWVVIGGVALSLFTPYHSIKPAWPILSALVVPPLLWQIATRLATAKPVFNWQSFWAWVLLVFLIGVALWLGGKMSPAKAILLSVVAVSLIWQVRKRSIGSTDLGVYGQLTLAVLLVEVNINVQPLRLFLGSLFSGASIGLLLSYPGIKLASRLPPGKFQKLYYLILVYVIYLMGVWMDTSAVAMVLMAGFTIASYSYSTGLWSTEKDYPAPLTQGWVFILLAGTWLMLGWQAHVPLKMDHVIGIVLGLLATAVGVLAGRLLAPTPGDERDLLRKERNVLLILLGVFVLWSQEAVLSPLHLAIALLAAFMIIVIMRIIIHEVFKFIGTELKWPGEGE